MPGVRAAGTVDTKLFWENNMMEKQHPHFTLNNLLVDWSKQSKLPMAQVEKCHANHCRT